MITRSYERMQLCCILIAISTTCNSGFRFAFFQFCNLQAHLSILHVTSVPSSWKYFLQTNTLPGFSVKMLGFNQLWCRMQFVSSPYECSRKSATIDDLPPSFSILKYLKRLMIIFRIAQTRLRIILMYISRVLPHPVSETGFVSLRLVSKKEWFQQSCRDKREFIVGWRRRCVCDISNSAVPKNSTVFHRFQVIKEKSTKLNQIFADNDLLWASFCTASVWTAGQLHNYSNVMG